MINIFLFPLLFFYFIVAVFVAFYLPGRFFLRRMISDNFSSIVIALILGMVLWGWQGFVFGYLHIRWLSYGYLLLFFILWLKNIKISPKKFMQTFPFEKLSQKVDWVAALLIILGVFLQLTAVWFVGTKTGSGLYFCCGNTRDNILYIAITHELVKQFPPFEPGMYGVQLQNYHYWGSLVVAELIRVFHLPLIPTLFQCMMLFLSIFLGLSAIALSKTLSLSKTYYRWLLFFLYFGGDAVYFLLIALGKIQNPFSMSSLEDGAKFLSNPPRAFAVVVFFAGLSLFLLWIRKKNWRTGIFASLVLGSLIEFKVYIGLFVLSGMGVLFIYYVLKRNYRLLSPIILTFLLAFLIYYPVNKNAGGLYYTGLWRFENFISQPSLGLIRLDMARQIFVQHNNWIKLVLYESLFIMLYAVSTFGTKLIALIQTKKSLSPFPKELHILLIPGFLVSIILGFFFEQSAGQANTFNFLVSVFILGSLYAALACIYWERRVPKKAWYIIMLLLVFLTVPRVLYAGWHNINDLVHHNGFLISQSELQGIAFLNKKTSKNALVLVDSDAFLMDRDSPYYSFLADRPMFLSGIGDELRAHGINFSAREQTAMTIFKSPYIASAAAALRKNNINYLVMRRNDNLASTRSATFLDPVFKNDFMKIYHVSSVRIKNSLQ